MHDTIWLPQKHIISYPDPILGMGSGHGTKKHGHTNRAHILLTPGAVLAGCVTLGSWGEGHRDPASEIPHGCGSSTTPEYVQQYTGLCATVHWAMCNSTLGYVQ